MFDNTLKLSYFASEKNSPEIQISKALMTKTMISGLALQAVGSTLRPVSPALRSGSGAGGEDDQLFVNRIHHHS